MSGRFNALLITALAGLLLPWHAACYAANFADRPGLEEQRERYQRATQALARGRDREFRALKTGLTEYPLYPYLIYAELSADLGHARADDIRDFLTNHADTPLAGRLRHRWLEHLRRGDRWRQFLAFYDPAITSTELACYFQRARYRAGQRDEAMAAALELWEVGKSQPRACDPLFEVLIDGGHITEAVAWRRYTLAVLNHQYQLAGYIERFLTSPRYRQLARNFLAVDRNSRVVGNYDLFDEPSPEILSVIVHGLRHLARTDALEAMKHWHRYRQTRNFDAGDRTQVITAIVKGLYRQEETSTADTYLRETLAQVPESLLEWRLEKIVSEGQWHQFPAWYSLLSEETRQEERWRYWLARSLVLESPGNNEQRARLIFEELAGERSYYGFLASEWLGRAPGMENHPMPVSAKELGALASTPAFRRIRELIFQDDRTSARREWYSALHSAPEGIWVVAAHLAERWQWHNQAIMSMIRASYWNDIGIRFPRPYPEIFATNARDREIPLPLLYALSRQESAFSPTVVSPAGARGLMQLMPATARQVARENGIAYRHSGDLSDPALNVRLGAAYYRQMLDRFGGNRILATAAYNAGPHRVDRWLRETGGALPFDAWIEAIPFGETRRYVQNVLAFSVIYGYHLNQKTAMLSDMEKKARL